MIQERSTFPRLRTVSAQLNKDAQEFESYKEVTKPARQIFDREISKQSKDSEISIAKVLLYIAAEDEAFLAFKREFDAKALIKEWQSVQDQSDPSETHPEERESVENQSGPSKTDSEELLQLDGKGISEWLSELDAISKEVETELASRDTGCHSVRVVEAINAVLFDLRGFKRTPITLDPKHSYLHSVLNSRCGTALLIRVIYIEVCQRLGVPIVGTLVGEDLLIWPQTEDSKELYKATSGQSLFGIVNGWCADDYGSMDLDIIGKSPINLMILTNRDIIGIALANMIRVYWRRASKSCPGLMLTTPLRPFNNNNSISSYRPLRPQDLWLAISAAQRLLLLEPGNWQVRRDIGKFAKTLACCSST